MSRTKGSFSLAGALEPLVATSLDARSVVQTKADLTAEDSFPYFYKGMEVYVTSENKKYRFVGEDPTDIEDWEEVGSGSGDNIQYAELPTPSATYENKIVQYIGETTANYTNGYFYKCVSDGESIPTYTWVVQPVGSGSSYTAGGGISIDANNKISTDNLQEGDMDDIVFPIPVPAPSGGGGDATLQTDIVTNLAVGAVPSGTTLTEGMTFTEVMQKLFITEIAPTTTFSASGSGVKEVGTSVASTLTLTITDAGTGTPTSIKFYDGSTLLDTQAYVSGTNTYTFIMDAVTTTKTVKGVLEYTKSDGTTTASIEKSASYTFVMASYYGAVTTAPTDKAGIIALTKNVKNTKAQTATFTLSNQRSCYCYPASFGNLTSIKDANNFEYLSSYTKTNVTVDDVSYNVYTLTDPVTATGFKQVYA